MRATCFVIVLSVFFFGCDGCSGSAGNGGRDGGTSGGDSMLPPGGCTNATQCGATGVCNPATMTCAADLPCTSHADCGAGAHCAATGTCAQSTTGSPCMIDDGCYPGERCIGGFCGCEGDEYGADRVPPNVLIVLDRSDSMNEDIGGGTKWEIALAAVTTLLASHGADIRFGLMLYPGTNQSCSAGMRCRDGLIEIAPADGTSAMIDAFLGGAGTCMFGTPTAEALEQVVPYPGLEDTTRANYVLLITDGQSTCEDPIPVAATLAAETPPVRTFVVGFGSGVDPTELDGLAMAGGTARAGGPPFYFQADDAASLASALDTIAGSVLSCTYSLSSVPEDVSMLYVYTDRTEVERDTAHTTGWDYDPSTNTITFYGATCDALLAGTVSNVVVTYGCPPILE
jgi:hypothetical protein